MSELRLAGGSTLEEANRILWEYLPRYNEPFAVPAAQDGSAHRSLSPELELAEVLCFKHPRKVARDNTVKYNWQTLQLLPGDDRRSYAGIVVEVRERLDGQLSVVRQSRDIPTQEATPRRSVLRDGNANQGNYLSAEGTRFTERIAALLPGAKDSGTPTVPRDRTPTPRMQVYWDAVQEAKSRGLSLRGIAREPGISRVTVTKYAKASGPPAYGEGSAAMDRGRRLTESLVSSP